MRKGIDCKGKAWEEISLYRKMVDATGMRFGNLVALFPVMCREKRQWLCQCDCGNELVVQYTLLKRGNTRSCGCYHQQMMSDRWEQYRDENNIVGTTFGRLTIVEFVEVDETDTAIYHFKCTCGNHVNLPLNRVKYGTTKSCGCLWQEWNDVTKSDIIGQRFGKLVACSYVGIDKHGNTLFECECDCGNTTILPRDSLVRNHTHSCGCMVSVGENNIKQILTDAMIPYKHNQDFVDLKSDVGGCLLYDFSVLSNDGQIQRLIEFDGEQHEKPIKRFGGNEKFIRQQYLDNLKNQYALSHNIPLVRIPYSKRDSMTLDDLLGDKYLIKEVARWQ